MKMLLFDVERGREVFRGCWIIGTWYSSYQLRRRIEPSERASNGVLDGQMKLVLLAVFGVTARSCTEGEVLHSSLSELGTSAIRYD